MMLSRLSLKIKGVGQTDKNHLTLILLNYFLKI